ncbi:MAG: hypothetical protein FWD89_03065, partial [Firmicutes bacterium]|nr:hypothetical protein [Bacillota bacterium]
LDKNFVYDGELLLKTDKKIASKDLYRMTVKITSSDNIKKNIIFNIFDYMPLKDFKAGKSEIPSIERKKTVEKYWNSLNLKWLKPLPLLYVGTDMKKIHELLDIYTKDDQEGIMVNIADGAYECKRSKNLLKVKKFLTADVRVISLEEGTGRNKGKLGAVHVEFEGPDKKLHTCKVGSGFKDEEREYYWQNKNEILGKIIEIGYFEITTNQKNDDYSLRFPTFKHIRNDKDEISMY